MTELNSTSVPFAHTLDAFSDHNNSSALPNDAEFDESFLFVIGLFILLVPIGGLVGNAVVIWFLSFIIKRTPITTYILNLAVADFSTLLSLAIAMTMLSSGEDHTDILSAVFLSMSSASVYLLTAISIERCLSVVFPIWYRCHRLNLQSVIVCSGIWAISFAVGAIRILFFSTNTVFNLVVCLVSILICVPAVLVCTIVLLVKVYCSLHRRKRGKFYTVLFFALLCFLAFGIPLNVVLFLTNYFARFDTIMVSIAVILCAVNSSINPLIYFLCGRKKAPHSKESFKVVLERAFSDKGDGRRNPNEMAI